MPFTEQPAPLPRPSSRVRGLKSRRSSEAGLRLAAHHPVGWRQVAPDDPARRHHRHRAAGVLGGHIPLLRRLGGATRLDAHVGAWLSSWSPKAISHSSPTSPRRRRCREATRHPDREKRDSDIKARRTEAKPRCGDCSGRTPGRSWYTRLCMLAGSTKWRSTSAWCNAKSSRPTTSSTWCGRVASAALRGTGRPPIQAVRVEVHQARLGRFATTPVGEAPSLGIAPKRRGSRFVGQPYSCSCRGPLKSPCCSGHPAGCGPGRPRRGRGPRHR